jgi:hypothetical protein
VLAFCTLAALRAEQSPLLAELQSDSAPSERRLFNLPWNNRPLVGRGPAGLPVQPGALPHFAPVANAPVAWAHSDKWARGSAVTMTADTPAEVAALATGAVAVDRDGKQTAESVPSVEICKIELPDGSIGEGYIPVPVKLSNSKGEERLVHFILDSGLTTTMITPDLRKWLDQKEPGGGGMTANGFAAGGSSTLDVCPLKGAEVGGCGIQLPRMSAVVLDFPQASIEDPRYDIQGMLGMEFVSQFDLDVDFPAGKIRLWNPGEGVKQAQADKLVAVPVSLIPGDILGVRVAAGEGTTPFLGVVDLGASFTLMNTAAAKLSNLPLTSEPGKTGIAATGVDGRQTMLASRTTDITLLGFEDWNDGSRWGDSAALQKAKMLKFDGIRTGVGEVAVFEQLLSTPGNPWMGPAGLLGLDIWMKTRIMFGAAPKEFVGRERTIYLQASGP